MRGKSLRRLRRHRACVRVSRLPPCAPRRCFHSDRVGAPPMRSLLFVPGYRDMLAKAWSRCATADALIPDLEDSVPFAAKEEARAAVSAFLATLGGDEDPRRLIPRVNAVDTEWVRKDIDAVVQPGVYGVTVGKVSTVDHVKALDAMISEAESARGLPQGHVALFPWIETSLALVHAYEICRASPRIAGVMFGADDLRADMSIGRNDGSTTYARNVIAVAACAARVPAYDTPWVHIKDISGLQTYIEDTKLIGFRGMCAIHPSHVDVINSGFSPSKEELETAQRIVDAFEAAAAKGRGSTSVDGKMVDVPVYRRNKALLQQISGT